MASTMEAALFLFLIAIVVLAGVVVLGPALRQAPLEAPSISLAPAPVVQQAARAGALDQLGLDVAGAEGHAVARHGDVARQILEAARNGYCATVYLECGADPAAPADGTKGYLVCRLANGQLGLVPFYVDALVGRLVAITAYAIRPGYEQYVTQRDGCVPVELLGVFLNNEGGLYAADQ